MPGCVRNGCGVQALKILSDILPKNHPELDAVREDLAALCARQHRHEGVVAMLGPMRVHRRPAFPDAAATLRRLAMLAAALSEMQRWRAMAEVTARAVKEAGHLWLCFESIGAPSVGRASGRAAASGTVHALAVCSGDPCTVVCLHHGSAVDKVSGTGCKSSSTEWR